MLSSGIFGVLGNAFSCYCCCCSGFMSMYLCKSVVAGCQMTTMYRFVYICNDLTRNAVLRLRQDVKKLKGLKN